MRASFDRKVGSLVGAALVGAALAAPASATKIYVHDASIGPYESVTITGGLVGTRTENYAGQQYNTVNLGSTYNPATAFQVGLWCVDIGEDIVLGSDYVYTLAPLGSVTSVPHVTWTPDVIRQIQWLAFYGNKHLANYTNADMVSYGTQSQFAAAVQVAIWNAEYGSTYAGTDNQIVTDLATLAAQWNHGNPSEPPSGGVSFALINNNGVQQLETYLLTFSGIPSAALPEPFSMAVVGSGMVGLFVLRRRRPA